MTYCRSSPLVFSFATRTEAPRQHRIAAEYRLVVGEHGTRRTQPRQKKTWVSSRAGHNAGPAYAMLKRAWGQGFLRKAL